MRAVVFALCLFPVSALAQEVDCLNETTQLDMTQCAYFDWQDADAKLNSVYAEAMANMRASDAEYAPEGASEEDRLRKAQRAWVAFRDANCDAAGQQMRGGSAEPMLINICLFEMTKARIAELATLTQDY